MSDNLAASLSRVETQLNSLHSELSKELHRISTQIKSKDAQSTAAAEDAFGDKRRLFHEKQFVERESLLTQMLSSGDASYRAIYHAMIATLIWLGVKLLIQDYKTRGIFIDFGLLTWAFDKFDMVLRIWIFEVCLAFCVVPLVQYVRASHNKTAALTTAAYIYMVAQLATELQERKTQGGASPTHNKDHDKALLDRLETFVNYLPSFASKQDVTLESVKTSQPQISIGDWNEEIGRFVFFIFCPTLVYRDSYPRNHGPINWVRAGVHTLNLAGVVLYTYVITRSLLVPLLEPVPPRSVIDIIMLVQAAMVPSILVFLLSFFGILHSWLNLWAELLRFSDRQFYSSWWTATSWPAYYRRWNLVVGDFLHSYVYNDIQRLGYTRKAAEIGVFVISALIHEQILACAFRFWYPALLMMFGGPGFIFMSWSRKFAGRFANVLLWLLLSVGLGILTVMYSRELYARYGYEWQGMPGVPNAPPYVYDPFLHPSPDWGVVDWIAYLVVPRSWLEFYRMHYMST